MTPPIRISSAAQRDIAAAQEWYAEQLVPDLDLRFQHELDQVFSKIEAFSKGFQVVLRDIRRANLKRFPYAVFYQIRDQGPYVLAVMHHARHPRTWQKRR